jgi:arylesterase/paraoxonase
MGVKKLVVIVCCVVVVLVGVFIVTILRDAGEFKDLHPHSGCGCVKVKGVLGPEDIAVDASTGTAYVSCSDFRALAKGEFRQGAIFSYALEGDPVLTNLTAGLKMRFAPHGISLFAAPDGRKYLFAVSHPLPRNRVEIFEIVDSALVHRETVEGDLLVSPNDIAAIGPRQFYFTNDHGSGSSPGKTMEDYLRLSRANIVYSDGAKMRIVADGLSYANGIWAAADGKRVYATATTGKAFYAFERLKNGDLRLLSTLDLGSGADNIDVDGRGRILVGSHPKLITFLKHAGNPRNRSPSQVLEVFTGRDGGYSFRELSLNDGEELSGCSVAAGYRDRLLLGAVFEDHFLDCACVK